MKRYWMSLTIALAATLFMLYQNGSFAQQSQEGKPAAATEAAPAVQGQAETPQQKGVPAGEAKPEAKEAQVPLAFQVDRTALNNGGIVTITGTAPPGTPVYIEVWADQHVRASRFDSEVDKETGRRPYILYMTYDMPAFYKILTPVEQKENLEKIKKEGSKWSYSQGLKDLGADAAYSVPGKIKIERYQATLMGSIVGSRGELLPAMDEKENKRRSMQLVKARFRNPDRVFAPVVESQPDGTFVAKLNIGSGSAPGTYNIRVVAGKTPVGQVAGVENNISFPNLYFSNAGTSINLFGPFFLTLAIAIFGVLMGAGGGFILNPLLVSIWPLPHTVVAGTVMPTVMFSQASGIVNYSKIKFISWKLGVTIGLAMVLGGFIGPKLTEMITLAQYKFVFGWILVILAGLMLWQTTQGYLAKHKKEQAILKEFKKRAEEAALAKASRAA